MYKTAEELRAELPSEQRAVPLSQGDILDACPLVFWADQTREVAEGDKPQSVRARVIILTQACDLANDKTFRAIVAVVHDAANLVQSGRVKEKFIRDNSARDRSTDGISFPPIRRARGSPSRWSISGTFIRCRGRCWKDFETRASRLPADHSLPRASRSTFLGHLLTHRPA